MSIFKKPLFLLALIIALAIFLRVYRLGSVPQSLNWDEVALGYNAYSILTTGMDEYGKFLPVVLRSYDDYKPALYTYFDIPFVGLLGLTEQAVRLPSVVAGIGAVIIVYFLILELFREKNLKILSRHVPVTTVALCASFFLAISPWHIQFSRIAFESNVGLTLNLLVFLFFLKGLKSHYFLPLSFFIASLNIHMYQSERVFSPLLVFVLSIIFFKKLIKIKKWVIVSVLVSLIVALPLVFYVLNNNNALLRAKGVSVFSSQRLTARSSTKLLEDSVTGNTLGKVLDNRRVEYVKAVVSGYISHFDLNWLFITGDIARHHAPFMGLLYLFELPFILIGIFILVYLEMDKRYKLAFFAYFLLVPIPASVTSGVPHAVRTLNFEWTFELFAAIGLIACIVFVLNFKNRTMSYLLRAITLVYILFSLLNFSYYINQYFVQMNYYNAQDWLYGYKQAIAYVNSIRNNYDKIVVENEVPFDQSYMFFLFYLKIDPSYYQNLGGTNSGGFKEKHKGFYNFTFEPVASEHEQGRVLLMGKPSDISETLRNRKIIYNPDGTQAMAIAEK